MLSASRAMDEQNGIGYKNTIPWHNKDDFAHFKQTTLNQTVILGRVTYDSLVPLFKNEVLPNRTKLIISTKDGFRDQICYKVCDVTSHITSPNHNKEHFFIIGGKQIYDVFNDLNMIDEVIVTVIKGVYNCDTFMDFQFIENQLIYNKNFFILKHTKMINNGIVYYYTRSVTNV